MIRNIVCFLLMSISLYGYSQRELYVNGNPINSSICAKIKNVKMIPEVSSGFIGDIKDAQLIEDCLELTFVYGGCNGNVELMTDSIIKNNPTPTIYFKLRWIEPSFCKALTLVKVPFDLAPYKALIKDKMAVIKIYSDSKYVRINLA